MKRILFISSSFKLDLTVNVFSYLNSRLLPKIKNHTVDAITLEAKLIMAIAIKIKSSILDYALGLDSFSEDNPINSSNSENGWGY